MLRIQQAFITATTAARKGCLSITTAAAAANVGGGVRNYSLLLLLSRAPAPPIMAKRKRAAVLKAEANMATLAGVNLKEGSSATPEDHDNEVGEDYAPGAEESEGFEPEPEPPKGRKKRAAAAASQEKPAPKKKKTKPAIDRKTFIKTVNKDGTEITRAPQFNSDRLPLPWKGRLGYACLNTYLRSANPPIFCSRTCRIDTILKQGTPAAGKEYVQALGLANARDLVKMVRWNERYGIRFLRISSEMFPFASHPTYGYSLEFAAGPLREAGQAAMRYGHRLTTHPGQFTQIASPKENVVEASVRDLEYHAQLLDLLGLEGQADRDAVMILHMGGVFGDKAATLARFRKNYTTLLSPSIQSRLVLENDDVNYTVHDLLPLCQSLNIPLVLDWHHHNLLHAPHLRPGSTDLLPTLPAIAATWARKRITQKQHYSEPRPEALTPRDMRKHSKRVCGLPPCEPDMDLMVEAKDKEQAVLGLYRAYGMGPPEGEAAGDVRPHVREDEGEGVEAAEVAMGGPERRVWWPEGCEEWLAPVKKGRAKKPKDEDGGEGLEEEENPPKPRTGRKTAGKKNTEEEEEAPPPPQPKTKTKSAKRQPKEADSDSAPEVEKESPPPRAKRQKKAAAAEATTAPATKKKRSATAKKTPTPASTAPDPGSPPLVTDDENEEVASAQQQKVFQEVDREVGAAQRRSMRVRKPVVR